MDNVIVENKKGLGTFVLVFLCLHFLVYFIIEDTSLTDFENYLLLEKKYIFVY